MVQETKREIMILRAYFTWNKVVFNSKSGKVLTLNNEINRMLLNITTPYATGRKVNVWGKKNRSE